MANVLVTVCAHADDAEINAGGTMAKWAVAGGRVHIVMVTNNCSGPVIPAGGPEQAIRRLGPAETHRIRHQEQEEAATLLGATVHYLNYWQRHYWNGTHEVSIGYGPAEPLPPGLPAGLPILIACNEPEHIDRMGSLLASLQPDLVLTQIPSDRDPEHHAVATMVWEAFSRRTELRHIPLRFWSPSTASPGGLFDPHYDHIEDISGFFDTKLRLCACHASQMTAHRNGVVARRAAYWGKQAGVAFGEPFRSAHWDPML